MLAAAVLSVLAVGAAAPAEALPPPDAVATYPADAFAEVVAASASCPGGRWYRVLALAEAEAWLRAGGAPGAAAVAEIAPIAAAALCRDPSLGASGWVDDRARAYREATGAVDGNRAASVDALVRADLADVAIDARVLQVLLWLAEDHSFVLGVLRRGHSRCVHDDCLHFRESHHFHGRAVDIVAVDGRPVSAANHDAHDFVREVLAIAGPLQAAEVGSPWDEGARSFTDADHRTHIHVGFTAGAVSEPALLVLRDGALLLSDWAADHGGEGGPTPGLKEASVDHDIEPAHEDDHASVAGRRPSRRR